MKGEVETIFKKCKLFDADYLRQCPGQDSNLTPTACKSTTFSTELPKYKIPVLVVSEGAPDPRQLDTLITFCFYSCP